MNRRRFIGTLIGGLAANCVPTFASEASEFEKCRNDILYFVDNHLVVIDSLYGNLKMSPQQREYLKRMSEVKDHLFCAKGRQIGASTANLVFAHWKTRFFENQRVFIVEPSHGMARCMKKMDGCIFHRPACVQKGSLIQIATPTMIECGIDWSDPNNTFILDEYAWWNRGCMNESRFTDLNSTLMGSQPAGSSTGHFIVVSTPVDHKDLFCTFVTGVDDSRRLVLPNKAINERSECSATTSLDGKYILPKFSSPEELRLKLMLMGVES